MRTFKRLNLVFGSLFILAFMTQNSLAQTYQLSDAASTLKIDGTSNIHDWTIVSEKQQGKIVVAMENGQVSKIEELEFNVPAESLKSGKSAMDKNTYKALNTDKHKKIVYKMTKVNKMDFDNGNCKVSTSGNLTISGKTLPINMDFELKASASQIVITGSKKIKMTDFGIDPPKAVFGTITTGDTVDVKFKSSFVK